MSNKLYRAAFSTLEQLESRRLLSANLVADHSGIYPTDSVTVDGTTFFTADDGVHGTELWKSDGTQDGTKLVKDITPGAGSTRYWQMTAVGDSLLFFDRDDNANTTTLWQSDGTAAGTIQIATVANTTNLNLATAVVNGKLIFGIVTSPSGADNGDATLWGSDGTAQGTHQLVQFGTEGGAPVSLHQVGSRVAFLWSDALWSTDGTIAGTMSIPCPQHDSTFGNTWSVNATNDAFVLNDQLIFADGERHELWKTDGTVQGTQVLKDVSSLYGINSIASIGDKLIFFGQSKSDDNYYLWSTDGTTAGTMQIAEIVNGSFQVTQANGLSYFTTGNGYLKSGIKLWVTDGTADGTHMVKLLKDQDQVALGEAGGVIFLVTSDSSTQQVTLWKSDGAVDGTTAIQDLGTGSATAFTLTEADGKMAVTNVADSAHAIIVDPSTLVVAEGPIQGRMKLTDGILRIFGTMDDDNIRIYRSTTDASRVTVDLDGTKKTFAISDISRIYVYAYSGDDKIALYNGDGIVAVRSRIWGGDGNDIIYGGSARDTIYGENGNDYVNSGGSPDSVEGGNGDDNIYTGAGNDTASGDDGADRILGGSGDDVLSGGNDGSHDHIDAGDGQNVIFGQAVYDIFFAGKQTENPTGMDEILLT